MAYLNVKQRTLETKIVYYGAGLSGKTTNLEMIKEHSPEGKCGDMMSLNTDGDRTLFFDWLPFNVGKFNNCDVRVQLYTVPGQTKYAETRSRVLNGADGIVLVLDSQTGALERNRQIVKDLHDHMRVNGLDTKSVPVVVQLNKRDLPTAMDCQALLAALDLTGYPHVEASAAKGTGVFETLRLVIKLVLDAVRAAARTGGGDIAAGSESGLDGHTLYTKLAPRQSAPVAPAPVAAASPRVVPQASEPSLVALTAMQASPLSGPVTLGNLAVAQPALAEPALLEPIAAIAAAPVNTNQVAEARSLAALGPDLRVADLARELASLLRADGGPQAQGMGELIAAQRALGRRLDALENNVQRAVERALAAGEAANEARRAELTKLPAQWAPIERSVSDTRDQVAHLAAALERLTQALSSRGDDGAVLASVELLQGELAEGLHALKSTQLTAREVEATLGSMSAVLLDELRRSERNLNLAHHASSTALRQVQDQLKTLPSDLCASLEPLREIDRQETRRMAQESSEAVRLALQELATQSRRMTDLVSLRLKESSETLRALFDGMKDLPARTASDITAQYEVHHQQLQRTLLDGLEPMQTALREVSVQTKRASEALTLRIKDAVDLVRASGAKALEDILAATQPKLEAMGAQQAEQAVVARQALDRSTVLERKLEEAVQRSQTSQAEVHASLKGVGTDLTDIISQLESRLVSRDDERRKQVTAVQTGITTLTDELRSEKKSWWRG